jgi:hypothetical protein
MSVFSPQIKYIWGIFCFKIVDIFENSPYVYAVRHVIDVPPGDLLVHHAESFLF